MPLGLLCPPGGRQDGGVAIVTARRGCAAHAPEPGADREEAACHGCVFHTDSLPLVSGGRACGELDARSPALGRSICILFLETELEGKA